MVGEAQRVDLPPVPRECVVVQPTVKVDVRKSPSYEHAAEKIRIALDKANVRLRKANRQTLKCLGPGGWYETIREGFNKPDKPESKG